LRGRPGLEHFSAKTNHNAKDDGRAHPAEAALLFEALLLSPHLARLPAKRTHESGKKSLQFNIGGLSSLEKLNVFRRTCESSFWAVSGETFGNHGEDGAL
jgi:hypothetical protein